MTNQRLREIEEAAYRVKCGRYAGLVVMEDDDLCELIAEFKRLRRVLSEQETESSGAAAQERIGP